MSYLLHFKSNESIMVSAANMEEAQEKAIELFESFGIVHSEVVGIIHTNAAVPKGQYVGENADGFACYTNVDLG